MFDIAWKIYIMPQLGTQLNFATQLDTNWVWCKVVVHKLSSMFPFNMHLLSFFSYDKLQQHLSFLSIFSEVLTTPFFFLFLLWEVPMTHFFPVFPLWNFGNIFFSFLTFVVLMFCRYEGLTTCRCKAFKIYNSLFSLFHMCEAPTTFKNYDALTTYSYSHTNFLFVKFEWLLVEVWH